MTSKRTAPKKRRKPKPPWRWYHVQAVEPAARKYRAGGDTYPTWHARLTALVGRTPVAGHWTDTGVPIVESLDVLLRLPEWATACEVGFYATGHCSPKPFASTEVTPDAATVGISDIDSPYYNLTTVLL